MDIVDFFWNRAQDRTLEEMAMACDQVNANYRKVFRQIEEENRELRLRVAALTRLLITRGVFSAEDFANSVSEVKAIVVSSSQTKARPARG